MNGLVQAGTLYVVAVSLLYLGTRLALTTPVRPVLPASAAQPPPGGPNGDAPSRRGGTALLAVAAVVAASLVLSLFLLLSKVTNALKYLFAALAVAGIPRVVLRCLRGWPARGAVGAALLACVAVWLWFPDWLTAGLVAAYTLVYLLTVVQPNLPFTVMAAIGLVFAFGYDAVQVTVTHSMTSLAYAGMSQSLPVLFAVPGHLSLHAPAAAAVGLGDVGIPGLLVVAAGRVSQRTGCPAVYRSAVGGYALGLLATLMVGAVWDAPVPATVFVIPGVAGAVLLTASRHGLRAELRRKPHPAPAA